MYIEVNQQMPTHVARFKLARRFKAFNSIIIKAGGYPPAPDSFWNLIATGAVSLNPAALGQFMLNYQIALQAH